MLALQARREDLPPEERAFLETWMADHPEDRSEAADLTAFLDAWKGARVPMPEGHVAAVMERVARLDETPRPLPAAAEGGWLARLGDLLLGVPDGVPAGRVLLARSLVLALGVLAGVLLYVASLRGEDGPNLNFLSPEDRAAVTDQAPAEEGR